MPIYDTDRVVIAQNFGTTDYAFGGTFWYVAYRDATPGVFTLNPQVGVLSFSLAGNYYDGAFERFYFRYHFDGENAYDFGLVSGNQTAVFSFWAAFFEPTSLGPILEEETTGVVLEGIAGPATVAPLEEFVVEMTITPQGPPLANGYYEFSFDAGTETATYRISFTGQRVLVWQVTPDWVSPMGETYEYRTKVITADDGSEQRIRLRHEPRATISNQYTQLSTTETTQLQRALLRQDQVFAVPYWLDVSYVTDAVPANSLLISTSRQIPQLVLGDTVVVETAQGYDAYVVEGLAGNQITTSAPTVREIPANAKIWRGLFVRLPQTQSKSHLLPQVNRASITFEVLSEFAPMRNELLPVGTYYLDLPVLDHKRDWVQGVEISHTFDRAVFDPDLNNRSYFYKWPYGYVVLKNDFTNLNRERTEKLISFFHDRKGRAKPFWIATGVQDLIVSGTLEAGSFVLPVETEDVAAVYEDNEVYRNLEIEFSDGTLLRRRITQFSPQAGRTDVYVDSPWARQYLVSEVKRVSWLLLSRFESDTLDLEHITSEHSRATLPTRALRYIP